MKNHRIRTKKLIDINSIPNLKTFEQVKDKDNKLDEKKNENQQNSNLKNTENHV